MYAIVSSSHAHAIETEGFNEDYEVSREWDELYCHWCEFKGDDAFSNHTMVSMMQL